MYTQRNCDETVSSIWEYGVRVMHAFFCEMQSLVTRFYIKSRISRRSEGESIIYEVSY